MGIVVLIFCLTVLVGLAVQIVVAERAERAWLLRWILLAVVVWVPVLIVVNAAIPFTGSGDDEDYYYASLGSVESLRDLLDPARFYWTHAQAGYPMLLTWAGQLAGESLLARKLVNVVWLLLVAVLVHDIGRRVAGMRAGRYAALAVLWLPSLWFYWMFLLKDLTVVLLQVSFIWVVIKSRQDGGSPARLLGAVFLTVALLAFRTYAVLPNFVVGLAALVSADWRAAGMRPRRLAALAVALMTLGVGYTVGSDFEMAQRVGVGFEDRVLSAGTVLAAIEQRRWEPAPWREAGPLRLIIFPLLFLMGEVSGLSPRGALSEANLIRGWLEVPWIVLGVPFVLAGLVRVSRELVRPGRRWIAARVRSSSEQGAAGEGWVVLLVFLGCYVVGSWLIGDTTRWKLPAVPVLFLVAAVGFVRTSRPALLLAGWLAVGLTGWAVYYWIL